MSNTCPECRVPLTDEESADGMCPICSATVPQFAVPEVASEPPSATGSIDDPFDELWFRRDSAVAADRLVPPPHTAATGAEHAAQGRRVLHAASAAATHLWRLTDDDQAELRAAPPAPAVPSGDTAPGSLMESPQETAPRYVMRIVPAETGQLHEVELTELELVELPRLAQRLFPGQYELNVHMADLQQEVTLLQFAIDGTADCPTNGPGTAGAATASRLLMRDSLGRTHRLTHNAEQQLWKRWHERVLVQHGITMLVMDEIPPARPDAADRREQLPSAGQSPAAPPPATEPMTTAVIAGLWSAGRSAGSAAGDAHSADEAELFRTTRDLRRLDSGLEELGRQHRRSGRSTNTRLALRRMKSGTRHADEHRPA